MRDKDESKFGLHMCNNTDEPIEHHTMWSKSEKDKYYMISLKCGIKKNNTNEFIFKTETDSQT